MEKKCSALGNNDMLYVYGMCLWYRKRIEGPAAAPNLC